MTPAGGSQVAGVDVTGQVRPGQVPDVQVTVGGRGGRDDGRPVIPPPGGRVRRRGPSRGPTRCEYISKSSAPSLTTWWSEPGGKCTMSPATNGVPRRRSQEPRRSSRSRSRTRGGRAGPRSAPGPTTHQDPSNGAFSAGQGTSRWARRLSAERWRGVTGGCPLGLLNRVSAAQVATGQGDRRQELGGGPGGQQVVDDLPGPDRQHAEQRVRDAVGGLVDALQVAGRTGPAAAAAGSCG